MQYPSEELIGPNKSCIRKTLPTGGEPFAVESQVHRSLRNELAVRTSRDAPPPPLLIATQTKP